MFSNYRFFVLMKTRCLAIFFVLIMGMCVAGQVSATGWSAAANLITGRTGHTATLLPNGKLLVVGGEHFVPIDAAFFNQTDLASAELYDPATNTWSSAGNMSTVRILHTATLLPDGKVLVAGGASYGSALASAELYDPATNSWSLTGSLTTGRINHTATLLRNGKVLVAVGYGDGTGVIVGDELYDPATSTWSPTGGLSNDRVFYNTATLLQSGKVLVRGARWELGEWGEVIPGTDALSNVAQYDPATSTWSPTGSAVYARAFHTATLLQSSKVLAAGALMVAVFLPAQRYMIRQPTLGEMSTIYSSDGLLTRRRCCRAEKCW